MPLVLRHTQTQTRCGSAEKVVKNGKRVYCLQCMFIILPQTICARPMSQKTGCVKASLCVSLGGCLYIPLVEEAIQRSVFITRPLLNVRIASRRLSMAEKIAFLSLKPVLFTLNGVITY